MTLTRCGMRVYGSVLMIPKHTLVSLLTYNECMNDWYVMCVVLMIPGCTLVSLLTHNECTFIYDWDVMYVVGSGPISRVDTYV